MTPKNRNATITTFNRRLINEDSSHEHLDGSNEQTNVRIDPEAQMLQTRTRTTHTPMQVESTSKSNEEGNENWSESDDVPQEKGATQFSFDPSISATDPQHHQ